MKKELLKGLTEEQIEKAKSCKNNDELLALAKAEGVKLNEEQLQAISGGACTSITRTCPWCGSYFAVQRSKEFYYCEYCSCLFKENGEIELEGHANKRKK